jgi:ADP-ribose pyrophosphatase YjhB (NUDIX family)
VSVGSVVVGPAGVLLIRQTYGPSKDYFLFPGGLVDTGEPLDEAAVREVREETGVSSEVEGICAVRTCEGGGKTQADVMFLLRTEDTAAHPGNEEIAGTRFFSAADLQQPEVGDLARYFGQLALAGELRVLRLAPDFGGRESAADTETWRLFR